MSGATRAERNEMRRFMVLPIAAILALTIAGPAMAGPNVSNTSGGGETIYGEWSAEGTYGYVFLGEDSSYGGFGEVYQESGEWVLCETPVGEPDGGKGGPSTQDTGPGEEVYGFVGTRTFGWASDLQITLSRRLETGTATGSVELYTETVDECNGIYGGDGVAEVGTINVSATGVGSLATFRGSGAYKIPSEFNGHENYRGSERRATGTVVAGSAIDTSFDWGYLSKVTWTMHSNE
jgi:hypothetical protein